MNRLSTMLIKAFALPLVVTFLIVQFILVMQFLWLYIDDLVGKGLEWWIIAELIFYASASFVPLALPLALLLASIMTLGSFAENGELMAVKASGISLTRFLRPLLMLVFGISLLAFYFSDTILPSSRLKFGSLLYDVQQKKPALAIKPGVFYQDIEGYTLMVRRKGKDPQTLKDIWIYDRTTSGAYPQVTMARQGRLVHSPDQRFLTIELRNGFTYADGSLNGNNSISNGESRIRFKKQTIHLDLSQLKLRRSDESLFKDYYSMLNTRQLRSAIDSLRRDNESRDSALNGLILSQYHWGLRGSNPNLDSVTPDGFNALLIRNPDLIQEAQRQIQTVRSYTEMKNREMQSRRDLTARYVIELHRKFSLSFACILLFLLGAPMGAIIRKGGLGLPTIVAVAGFLVYHILTMTSEKLARDGSLAPEWSMWVSSIVLLPVALVLVYRANRDRTFRWIS
jgi:lipopolysaccharide export system permease protein